MHGIKYVISAYYESYEKMPQHRRQTDRNKSEGFSPAFVIITEL